MLLIAFAVLFIFGAIPLHANASATDCYKYILPLKYDSIEIGDKYIFYKSNGKWGRTGLDGTILTGAVYATLDEAENKNADIKKSSFTPYKSDNGLYGYKNGSGEIIITAKYDAVANSFENNAAIVRYKGKYGIINTSGEVVFDFVCDTLYKSDLNNYYAYTKNDKTGFIDDKFQVLSEPFLRAIFVKMYDDYVVYQAVGNKYGLATYDGRILCGAIWDYMRDFCEGLAAVGVNEDFYGINARWGYIDKKGNTVIPAIYDCYNTESLDFSDGLAGVCEGSSGFYIDKNGKTAIKLPRDTYPYTNFSNDMAVVAKDLEKKYINKNGEVVLEAGAGVKWLHAEKFVGDLAVVSLNLDTFTEGSTGVICYLGNTPSPWAQTEVTAAIKGKLVPDDLCGQYTAPITREEYCRLAITLIETYKGIPVSEIAENVDKNVFTDTSDIYVLCAQSLGIVEGRGSGIFDPNGKISRQEAAKILVNTFKSCAFIPAHTASMPSYNDRAIIAVWANEGIWYTGEWGVMIGVGNNLFAPNSDYTREQSVMTMIRLYNILMKNRPQTLFISPGITVMDGSKTDKYNADPKFFIKITIPVGWSYDYMTGDFTISGKRAATLSDVIIYPDGAPLSEDNEKDGIYYFISGGNIKLTLSFNGITSADVKRIRESVVIYDREKPSMTDDIESYMYDVSRRAFEAFDWFEMSTMTARCGIDDIIAHYSDNTQQEIIVPKITTGDGYTEIGDSEIKTYADLEAYLKTLFSDQIAGRLLEGGMYRDIDGKLYGADASRGSDITKGSATAAITRAGDNKILYTLTVELLGEDHTSVTGYETHEFTYELIGSKWVWTKFYLYK